MASQITSITIVYSTVYSGWFRSKKTSKLRVNGLCVGNSTGTGEFPAQMASSAENVSIWWRHHGSGIESGGDSMPGTPGPASNPGLTRGRLFVSFRFWITFPCQNVKMKTTNVYIHIYQMDCVFDNVTTKSAQHAHARMIAIIVEKSPITSHMYDHGFMDNTNRQAVCKSQKNPLSDSQTALIYMKALCIIWMYWMY